MMMRIKLVSTSALLLTCSLARAQIVDLRVRDYGWIGSIPVVRDIFDDYLEQVEFDLNQTQPIEDPNRLMTGTANSTALSSRGIGADYATDYKRFIIGASVGAAADMEKDVGLKDNISGVGASAGIMFGYHLSDRWNLYANVGGLSRSHTFNGILDTDLDADITTVNLGTHAQYTIFERVGDDWLGWGGLRVTLGYEYNDNKLVLENFLNEEINLDTGAGVIQGRLKGFPKYEVNTRTHSIPLELSSNVTFLKIFNLYAGVGADYNFGKAEGGGDAKANAFSPLACVSGACTNLDLPEIEAVGNLDAEENVEAFFFRGFAGLQLDLPYVKIYGQVNKTFGDKLTGAAAGIRLAF